MVELIEGLLEHLIQCNMKEQAEPIQSISLWNHHSFHGLGASLSIIVDGPDNVYGVASFI